MKNSKIKRINGYAISSFILSLPIIISFGFYSVYGTIAGVTYDFTHYDYEYTSPYYLALLVIICTVLCFISIILGIIALINANDYKKRLRILAIVGIIISIVVPMYVYIPRLLRPWDDCSYHWCSSLNTTIQMDWQD